MSEIQHLSTGVEHLDDVLGGGLPIYSCQIVAGGPGAGKTILAQQIAFHTLSARPDARALYLTTVSEPMPKVVRFMQQFSFFKAEAVGERVLIQDVGPMLREVAPDQAVDALMDLVTAHRPDLLVIDSFKAIRDLQQGPGDFRLFVHDLASRLAAARCTALLLGEYDRSALADGAEFAVADGITFLETTNRYGDSQRSLQVLKMRGQAADLRSFPFLITSDGVKVLASREEPEPRPSTRKRVPTGVPGLDALLDGGFPGGRAVLLSGRSGTGKTTLGLQMLNVGCRRGERSLLISFEQTPARLWEMAAGFGWDLEQHERDGLLRTVYVPQSSVRVIPNLDLIAEAIDEFQPDRVLLDSLAAYLHRVRDLGVQQDMTFRLVSLIQQHGATGLLVSDATNEADERFSRFGVEETVADGVVLLSTASGEFGQRRYLQVPKMRACPHVTGRKRMAITEHGVEVYYDPPGEHPTIDSPDTVAFGPVEPLLEDGLAYGTTWLVRGTGGVGKTTLLQQFVADGLNANDDILYVTLDSTPDQVRSELRRAGIDVGHPDSAPRLRFLAPGAHTSASGSHTDLDLADPEALLFLLNRQIDALRAPARVVLDSIWPLAARLPSDALVSLVQQKNQTLRRPYVTILDTAPTKAFDERTTARLENSYDAVLELTAVGGRGPGRRIDLSVKKIRGVGVRRESVELKQEADGGVAAVADESTTDSDH
ncbi:ATPase domain-containing protein [Alienimonas chondri]|uniref:Circadian clock protein kinase KaiC n=1 Tax=Alienimonas chondri TaxID=2681879 RepID=A0ABX1V847_9PLAN|nr:ATPase domain-containing protein [Alienimonas chondri]NNJ24342.1 Circadian clock protein kinase KaiC [Alienimonas chondri]